MKTFLNQIVPIIINNFITLTTISQVKKYPHGQMQYHKHYYKYYFKTIINNLTRIIDPQHYKHHLIIYRFYKIHTFFYHTTNKIMDSPA